MSDLRELMQPSLCGTHWASHACPATISTAHERVSQDTAGPDACTFLHRETQKLGDATVTPHRDPYAPHAWS